MIKYLKWSQWFLYGVIFLCVFYLGDTIARPTAHGTWKSPSGRSVYLENDQACMIDMRGNYYQLASDFEFCARKQKELHHEP